MSTQPTSTVGAWIGIDWANRTHEGVLRLADGQQERFTLDNQPERLHSWLGELRERFAGHTVVIAVEKTRSQLINILVQYSFVQLYLVNPGSVAKYREAFAPSGAKDDPGDAELILTMVFKHADQLTPWKPDDAQTRLLRGLCEERRHAVDQRTKLVEELTSKIQRYYPQGIELAGGDLTTTMACDFLCKFPELDAVKKIHDGTLRKFYYAHNSRNEELIRKRLEQRRNAVAVTEDRAIIEPLKMTVLRIAQQIRALNASIAGFDQQIATIFPKHPDAAIFASFPGAGPVLAPRLLAEFGTDRQRYPEVTNLQCRAGIAPVTEKSGNSQWVHRRWRCAKFSLQTFHEYAASSLSFSVWAKAYYQYRKDKDRNAKHHTIIRTLAYKWMRILYAAWVTRSAYDEAAYITALRNRNSPICAYLP